MRKITIALTSTLALLCSVSARFGYGACPKVTLQENFDASKYLGPWYEIVRDEEFTFG